MIRKIIICLIAVAFRHCYVYADYIGEESGKNANLEFASLSSDSVNFRVGPGEEYPIIFRYSRKLLPLYVIAKFGVWRKVRDKDGDEGWVCGKFLSKTRTIIVNVNTLLYMKPDQQSIKLAILEKDVVAKVVDKCGDFVKIKMTKISGWVKREDVWGAVE